jgi:DNA helicase-4
MTYTLYRNFFGKWFGKAKKIKISEMGITLIDVDQNTQHISVNQLTDFPQIEETTFGKTLVIKTKNEVFRIWGMHTISAKTFDNITSVSLNNSIINNITAQLDFFHKEALSQYLRDSSVDILNESVTPFIQSYKTSKEHWQKLLSKQQLSKIDVISRMPSIQNVQSYRQYYEKRKLVEQAAFFDEIESNPLTSEQRLAVIRNNDKNLILAAAGTGKTSVMVAKALSLMTHDKVPADKVLLLAYNNAAAKELKERLEARKISFGLRCESPTIMTFHALSLKVLKEVKANTRLSCFANDPIQLEHWFTNWFEEYISHSYTNMKRYIDLAYNPDDTLQLSSTGQYVARSNTVKYQTVQGERVNSHQELLIANWLFLHSVNYQYQENYHSKSGFTVGRKYKPCFHINNTTVYIEYFIGARDPVVQSDGNSNQTCETALIEIYDDDLIEDHLEYLLVEQLERKGISLERKYPNDVLTELKRTNSLTKNCKKYLKLLQIIRVEQLNSKQVEARLNNAKIHNVKQYTELLDDILQAYTAELTKQKAIDFDDMISLASQHITCGNLVPYWTDILVDEFQDISTARVNLLNELINKGPSPRLTVVGDDWQSIYRFSGAKLALITQFKKYFGSHSATVLQKTFRYNNSIAETAGKFVMQNPEQYIKKIVAHHQVKQSQVYLVDSNKRDINESIAQVVKTIKANDPTGSIALLARYRYLLNNAEAELSIDCLYENISYWTFHGSKGLEADYCILVGLSGGNKGFPNVTKEDSVIDALLPQVDSFRHSEERRLFYVAMTRAKKKVYLIADLITPSEFISELLSVNYDLQIIPKHSLIQTDEIQ